MQSEAGFVKKQNSVKDTIFNLQWQDNLEVLSSVKTWSEAIVYCEKLSLDGAEDWRLPNFNELYTIVDRSNPTPSTNADITKSEPFIVDGFESKNTKSYWSSTSVAHFTYQAWTIDFYTGDDHKNDKFYKAYTRCVRSY
jgi:hypothetical protein